MSEGITGADSGTPSESAAPSAPAAPTTIDGALEQSFAASMTAETAPVAPPPPAVENGEPLTTEAAPQEDVAPVAPTDGKEGPIPFQVHKTALENARVKAEREVTERLTQEWQTQVAPVRAAAEAIARDVTTDSIDGLTQLIREYGEHPKLGPQVRSLFGRMLGQQRGAQPAATPLATTHDDPEPQADFEANGTPFFSGPQLQKWHQWNERRMDAKVQQQLQPIVQRHKQQELQQTATEMRQKALNAADAQYRAMSSDPDFVEHQALVQQRMAADRTLTAREAWGEVYREVVVPKKVQQAESKFVQAARAKSAGSTVDPTASAVVQPRRARTVDEGLNQVFDALR